MFGQESDEVHVYDASAYFSEEEWKLLQDWQKEFYRNVMKEIHQALASLGPLIASVFTLRSKEIEELPPVETTATERKVSNNHSSAGHEVTSFPIKGEGDTYCMDSHNRKGHNSFRSLSGISLSKTDVCLHKEEPDSIHIDNLGGEVREGSRDHILGISLSKTDVCLHKEEPDSILIDSLGEKVREGSTDHILGISLSKTDVCLHKEEPESILIDNLGENVREGSKDQILENRIVAFHVGDDEEIYCTGHHGSERQDGISSHRGTGSRKKTKNSDQLLKCRNKSMQHSPMVKTLGATMNQNVFKRRNSSNQMQLENGPELGGEGTAQWHAICVQRSETKICRSAVKNDIVTQCETTPVQRCTLPTYPERDSNCEKDNQIGYQQASKLVGRYTCTECGKGFSAMSKLITHERTHTGERPFHCNVCGKSFNQIGVLHRHQRMHTGERPYPCGVCGKSFNRKDYLRGHQNLHKKAHQNC